MILSPTQPGKNLPGGYMLTATISHHHSSDTTMVWKRKMNRKSWKWEKIKREKRRTLCHLSYSVALFSNYCIPLHLMQDQAMAMWHTPADGRPAETMAVNTRLERCSNFFLSEIQSDLHFGSCSWGLLRRESLFSSLLSQPNSSPEL